MKTCKYCAFYAPAAYSKEELERYGVYDKPDGVCNKYFPRGYVSRKPPHKAKSNQNACFQYEERSDNENS